MLKRHLRLPLSKSLQNPQIVHAAVITVKIMPNDFSYSRFGFVVSKRVDARATARNRIKRGLSRCIEEHLSILRPGFDVVLIAKPAIIKQPEDSLCGIIASILQKSQLLT